MSSPPKSKRSPSSPMRNFSSPDPDHMLSPVRAVMASWAPPLIEGDQTADLSGDDSSSNDEEEMAAAEDMAENERVDMNILLTKSRERNQVLIDRLHKRGVIIESIKSSYLRDVVTMKNVLAKHFTTDELKDIMDEWKTTLPSVDLRQPLALFAPMLSHVKMRPCGRCGGTLDVEYHDSSKSEQMRKKLSLMKERNEELRLSLAKMQALSDRQQIEHQDAVNAHEREKRCLYDEIRKIKEERIEMQEKLDESQQVNKRYRDETVQLKKSNRMLVENVKEHTALEEKCQEALHTVEKLRVQLFKSEEKNTAMETEFKQEKARTETLERAGGAAEEHAKALTTHVNNAKMQIVVLGEELEATQIKAAELEKDLKAVQLQVGPLKSEIKSMRHDHAIDVAALESVADGLRAEVRMAEAQYRMVKDQNMRSGVEAANKDKVIDELQDLLDQKDEELDELETQLKKAVEQLESLKAFMAEDMDKHGGDRAALLTKLAAGDAVIESSKSNLKFRSGMSDEEAAKRRERMQSMGARTMTDFARRAVDIVDTIGEEETAGSSAASGEATPVKEGDPLVDAPPKVDPVAATAAASEASSPLKGSPGARERNDGGRPPRRTSSVTQSRPVLKVEEEEDDGDDSSLSTIGTAESTGGPSRNFSVVATSKPPPAARRGGVSASAATAANANATARSHEGRASLAVPGGAAAGNEFSQHAVKAANAAINKYEVTRKTPGRPAPKATGSRRTGGNTFVSPSKETVELAGVRDDAPPEEIALREAILCTLTATVGPIPAKKAINALAPVCSLYGSLLSGAMDGMWEAMILNRRAADFMCKLGIIFDRMVSCAQGGVTSQDVSRICQDCVPLAMSSLGGSGLMSSWQDKISLHEILCQELAGTVDHQTGDVRFKAYVDYFGTDEDFYMSKLNVAAEGLGKIRGYADESLKKLNTSIISVLKEWSDAKAVFIDIDMIVEKEKQAVREAADMEINGIISELSNTFAKLEAAKEAVRMANSKVDVAATELTVLRPLPKKLETSEARVRDLLGKINSITAEQEVELKKTVELKRHVHRLDDRIEGMQEELKVITASERAAKVQITKLEHVVEEKTQVIEEVSGSLTALKEENHHRLNSLQHISTQTIPQLTDALVQTEFVCPPMSLRTSARINNWSSTKTSYPMVFSTFPDGPTEESAIQAVTQASHQGTLNPHGNRYGNMTSGSSVAETLESASLFGGGGAGMNDLLSVESASMGSLAATSASLRHKLQNLDEAFQRPGTTPRTAPLSSRREGTGSRSRRKKGTDRHGDSKGCFPDFSDDMEDDLSMTSHDHGTGAGNRGNGVVAVLPRDDGESSVVTCPAGNNSVHECREFLGVVPRSNMDDDVRSLVSGQGHRGDTGSRAGSRMGTGTGTSIDGESIATGSRSRPRTTHTSAYHTSGSGLICPEGDVGSIASSMESFDRWPGSSVPTGSRDGSPTNQQQQHHQHQSMSVNISRNVSNAASSAASLSGFNPAQSPLTPLAVGASVMFGGGGEKMGVMQGRVPLDAAVSTFRVGSSRRGRSSSGSGNTHTQASEGGRTVSSLSAGSGRHTQSVGSNPFTQKPNTHHVNARALSPGSAAGAPSKATLALPSLSAYGISSASGGGAAGGSLLNSSFGGMHGAPLTNASRASTAGAGSRPRR